MPSPRARLRRAVLGKTDAKIARTQRQLEAQAKELAAIRAQQMTRFEALSARTDQAVAAEARRAKNDGALQRVLGQVAELARRTEELTASVATLTTRLDKADAGQRARDVEFEIRRTQLGVIETRLGRVEETSTTSSASGSESVIPSGPVAEASELVAEVRREHEQIRIRMQIISSYEERLRRVEESLLRLYDGDHRHRL